MTVQGLKDAFPYLQKYRGSTFVIKVGGALLDDVSTRSALSNSISVLWHLGIKLLVVHGGGPRMDNVSQRLDVPQTKIGGRRITTQPVLEVAQMVLRGLVNTELVSSLQQSGVSCVGLCGVDGTILKANKRPPVLQTLNGVTQEVDYGFVGDICHVDTRLIEHLWSGDFLPVVASLSVENSGQVLNTNADSVAKELAVALSAQKLIFVTDQPGLLKDPADQRTLIPYIDLEGLAHAIEVQEITGGMLPKVEACADAIRRGVPRVHIIGGRTQDSLLSEIFTNEGCGTLIVKQMARDIQA